MRAESGARPALQRALFLSPWLASFFLFAAFPLLYALALSFREVSPLSPDASRWVGFAHWERLAGDASFWRAMGNTAIFVAGTIPVTTALALALALALDRALPLRNLLRGAFFVPSIISLAVVAVVFKQLYAPHGLLNQLGGALGLPRPSWLLDPALALGSIMAMDVWAAAGYYMLLFLAGLQTVPRTQHEAVALDGGGWWAGLRHVTLPHLRPVLLVVVLVNTIRSLQVFIEVFVMTQGGPLGRTRTVVYELYDRAFYRFDLGYACAIGYALFLVILLVSLAEARWLRMGRAAAEGGR